MLIIGAGAGILICFCCIAIALSYGSSGSTNSPFSTERNAKYVVSGSATSASITYNNEQGGTEQVNVNLPWEKEMKVSAGAILTIVAQNGGSGSLTCEIWVDDEQRKTSTSTAQYGVVTCTEFTP